MYYAFEEVETFDRIRYIAISQFGDRRWITHMTGPGIARIAIHESRRKRENKYAFAPQPLRLLNATNRNAGGTRL